MAAENVRDIRLILSEDNWDDERARQAVLCLQASECKDAKQPANHPVPQGDQPSRAERCSISAEMEVDTQHFG